MKRLFLAIFGVMVMGVLLPTAAQDATATPETPDFALTFPVTPPTDSQIRDAYDCKLDGSVATATSGKPTACELANQAVTLAKVRGDNTSPSDEELKLVGKVASLNPALLLDIGFIQYYYDALPLVEPPAFAQQPITDLSIRYTFSGLGSSTDYTITITNADSKPIVSGNATNSSDYGSDTTATPSTGNLSGTVDSSKIQAFSAALRDFVPIAKQFKSIACYDYYPDWVVDLTFADGSTVEMVTNQSNVVGIGGPWQTEIDGQNYLQYSGAFSAAIGDLFDALKLEFGQTAAMTCGGATNPLEDAFPKEATG